MAFMLGSLTSGMFGAMDDVMRFGKNLQEYRANQKIAEGGKEVGAAAQGEKGAALPAVQSQSNIGPSGGSMDRHDDNPAGKVPLSAVKQPNHLSFGPSAREHDNNPAPAPKPPAGTDETTPNTAGGGAVHTGTNLTPQQMYGSGGTGQNMSPQQMYGGGTAVPTGGAWGGAPTGTPAARTAAPKYLPTPANPSGGQPQTGPAAVFGANQAPGHQQQAVPTQQTAQAQPGNAQPVPGGPGTPSPQQAGYGASPTLANGQSGLGAQLMASMNPTTGATS